jgi:MFS family permease
VPPSPAPPLGDLIPPRTTPLSTGRRALYLIGGLLCMIGGVVGWLIPVVTGIPFYIAGAFMLAAVSPVARRSVNWVDRKLPDRMRRALRRNRTADTPGESSDPGR